LAQLRILSSHPVQYHVPFFQRIASEGVEIEVGYYHQGTAGRVSHDAGFGIDINWDIDLLSGYSYKIFLEDTPNYRLSEQLKLVHPMVSWALKNRQIPLLIMGWFSELIWLIWLLRILLHAPVIMMCETTPLSFAAASKPRWRIMLLNWLLQHTTANLYIGSRNRDFLLASGVSARVLFPAPYSIDNDRFAAEADRLLPQRRELCRRFGLDPALPTLLFCGKLIGKKRPLQLLDAYLSAGLADRAQLVYVGEGELRSELEHQIQTLGLQHVHLLGFFNQNDMPLAYVLGELLCLISEPTETWGLVVNEALACGRPVIVSTTVGCGPDLVEIENGWVTQLNDHQRLTETLLLALDRREEWTNMGKAGRTRVSKNTFSEMAAGAVSALDFIQGTCRGEEPPFSTMQRAQ
jgi:glycosyltransferase involved in cell wall biosynthesis